MDKPILVKDVMVTKFKTISQEATIREASKILHRGGFSGAPVVNKKGAFVGIISEKDLFKALYPSYSEYYEEEIIPSLGPEEMEKWLAESSNKQIKNLVKEPITTTPETPLVKIGALMLAKNIHRLPVLKNGKLVGVISRRLIYRSIFNHLFGFGK